MTFEPLHVCQVMSLMLLAHLCHDPVHLCATGLTPYLHCALPTLEEGQVLELVSAYQTGERENHSFPAADSVEWMAQSLFVTSMTLYLCARLVPLGAVFIPR